jgi:hypothetical protein
VQDTVDQSRYFGGEKAIVAEERAERLRHGEDELAMRDLEQNLICQMLGAWSYSRRDLGDREAQGAGVTRHAPV